MVGEGEVKKKGPRLMDVDDTNILINKRNLKYEKAI
jgi:hypothetical protein